MKKDKSLNDEQNLAVYSRGCSILVSASAGSGKTKILVNRMMSLIEDDHVNVDSLLVLTFTKAAALEMKQRLVESLDQRIQVCDASLREHLEKQKSLLQHRVNIQEQTNEEIARLALKEASELIDKAKKNANMILSESLEYVRSLSGEMSDFKAQAVKFRASVEKMSKDILESIDQSEVYNLINEDKYDEGDSL